MKYDVEITITLLDGTEKTERAAVEAPHEPLLHQLVGQMVQSIASAGVLKFDRNKKEFTVDPTPGQIRRVHARLPVIALARSLASEGS